MQWQLDRLTDGRTDGQMKQTQGPQRLAFCTNQVNIFNKAYRYQTAIQLYEKNLTIHSILNVQMLQKRFVIQAIKKKHHRNWFKKKKKKKEEAALQRSQKRQTSAPSS